jgi:shikimate 5-dehydrogenase
MNSGRFREAAPDAAAEMRGAVNGMIRERKELVGKNTDVRAVEGKT